MWRCDIEGHKKTAVSPCCHKKMSNKADRQTQIMTQHHLQQGLRGLNISNVLKPTGSDTVLCDMIETHYKFCSIMTLAGATVQYMLHLWGLVTVEMPSIRHSHFPCFVWLATVEMPSITHTHAACLVLSSCVTYGSRTETAGLWGEVCRKLLPMFQFVEMLLWYWHRLVGLDEVMPVGRFLRFFSSTCCSLCG